MQLTTLNTYDEVQELMQKMLKITEFFPKWRDPFDKTEMALLSTVFLYPLYVEQKPFSLKSAKDIIVKMKEDEREVEVLFEAMRKENPCNQAVIAYDTFMLHPKSYRREAYQDALTRIEIFERLLPYL